MERRAVTKAGPSTRFAPVGMTKKEVSVGGQLSRVIDVPCAAH
jgi:hypothetical protein